MTIAEARAAVAHGESQTDAQQVKRSAPYVWDGVDESDRPATRDELQAGIEAVRRCRSRPVVRGKV